MAIGILFPLLGLFLLAGALYLHTYIPLVNSGAYKSSLTLAQSSQQIQKFLGNRIHTWWPAVGVISHHYHSDFAQWSVSLVGSSNRGRLSGVANRIGAAWEFSRLVFASEDGSLKVDLAPEPKRLTLPNTNIAKVYLVPLGLSKDESLAWAPTFYRAKFGLDVEVLPGTPLTTKEIDNQRKQLIAEECAEALIKSHPDFYREPSTLLVGVTSHDMFIRSFDWAYAENYRENGHVAVLSSARLRPTFFLQKRNPELLAARLQKLLSKNLAILAFNLPMSSDYTSLVSGGVLSGDELDFMSGDIVGAEGRWDSFIEPGGPGLGVVAIPGKKAFWQLHEISEPLLDVSSEVFDVDFATGLFISRKSDFYFDDEFPLQFVRTYNSADNQSRAFGVGTLHSLDIFLVGRMGEYVDLIQADGARAHFDHVQPEPGQSGQLYRARLDSGTQFSLAKAVFEGGVWRVTTKDGWNYLFPYRPKAQPTQVTVLTGYIDPGGHRFEMNRNDDGDLLSITTPSGEWLHFEPDGEHRIRAISDSLGRSAKYSYDKGGRLVHFAASQGISESYAYDERGQMISVKDDAGITILTNKYSSGGQILHQELADGRHFEYGYTFGGRNILVQSTFTDPSGLITYFDYCPDGYRASLPTSPPH